MRRLTLLDNAKRVCARIVERDGTVFALDVGDAALREEIGTWIEDGLPMLDGRFLRATDPTFLDELAAAYQRQGWTLDFRSSLTQHGAFKLAGTAKPTPAVVQKATGAALQTLYPIDTFGPGDTVTERHVDFRRMLDSVEETQVFEDDET